MNEIIWISFFTLEELKDEKEYYNFVCDIEKWNKNISDLNGVKTFKFGQTPYPFSLYVLSEINSLKVKIDDFIAFVEYLFLQYSERENYQMFIRFVAANLANNKIVIFWSEKSGFICSENIN